MPQLNLILIWLFQRLLPNGRAFKMPPPIQTGGYLVDEYGNYITDENGNFIVSEDYTIKGGILFRLFRAISIQFAIAWNAAKSVQNAQLPDNPYFTIGDARDWYRRLGIYDSGSVPLEDMKAAIRQRMSFPLVPLQKQHYSFIQDQLQLAGFNVIIVGNRFPDGVGGYTVKTVGEVLSESYGLAEYGSFEYGDTEYGTDVDEDDGVTIIANYLEDAADAAIVIDNLRSTFFVCNPTGLPFFANVPEARHTEFRQLLLKLKPLHTQGYVLVNYT